MDLAELFAQVELAQAAYAPLNADALSAQIPALQGAGFRLDQAGAFAGQYALISQFRDDVGASFSATVFEDTSGELTLAIRGTAEFIGDIVPTDADILVGGAGYDQIVAMVNWWNRVSVQASDEITQNWVPQYRLVEYLNEEVPAGAVVLRSDFERSYVLDDAPSALATGEVHEVLSPGQKVSVTGHSLGGHLAMAFSSIFYSDVGQVVVFNAPGFKDTPTNQAFFQKLGGSIPNSPSIINVAADESRVGEVGFYPVARLHSGPGQLINVAIENQLSADEPNPVVGAWNHSIRMLTDSLAVYSLLAGLDTTLQSRTDDYKAVLNRAAQGTAGGYERIVDALEVLFNRGRELLPVGNGDDRREQLYQAIYGLRDAESEQLPVYGDNLGLLQIQPMLTDAASLVAAASQEGLPGLAYRYALKNLDPFVVLGEATQPLYAQHNANGELDFYDAATGTGALTQQWLQDRAEFLERKLYINGLDTDKYYQVQSTDPENPLLPPDAQGVAYQNEARLYVDQGSDFTASSGPNPNALQHHIFGTDGADVLHAPVSGREDWLYGSAGRDFLAGHYANDYLEGGKGFDTYRFGTGDAQDTVLDSGGEGILVRNGAALALGVRISQDVWQLGGMTYTKVGNDLEITFADEAADKITVRDFDFTAAQAGSYLGIRFIDAPTLPQDPARTFLGDKADWDSNPNEEGTQTQSDAYGNVVRADGQGDPARPDIGQADRADTFYGSAGPEVEWFLTAGGDDVVYSDRPNGVVSSQGGRDRIETGAGRDIVGAGAGDDWIEGGTEGDVLAGNDGNDVLYSDSSAGQTLTVGQAIAAGNTDTPMTGLQDLLSGDAGDDLLISSAGADYLAGGAGRDVIVGGAGDDTIYGDRSVTHAPLDWSLTRFVDEQSEFDIYVVTTSTGFTTAEDAGAADTIYGGAGDDWIFAGGGDDFVDAGPGENVVLGQAGNDIIIGGAQRDILSGDSAETNANGTFGDDYLEGGAGDDDLFGGNGNDILIGGAGEDQLIGGEGDDVLYGGANTDVLQGGAGRDTYVYFRGDGYDIVNDPDIAKDSPYLSMVVLGPGITKADVKFRLGSLVVDLGEGDAIQFLGFDTEDPLATPMLDGIQFADGGVMTFPDILEQGFDIDGTEDDDVLFGTPYTDRIDAKGGDDTVIGRAGDDTIQGGTGNDWLEGNDGNDEIDGGEGNDELYGGWGDDLLQGGDGEDALAGEGGFDTLEGGAGSDSLVGHDGDDTLNGGTGDDLLIGNEGSDTYTFAAGDGNDLIDEQASIALGVADEAGIDVIRFDASVTPGAVTLSRSASGDLTIGYGTGDSIRVIGQFTGAAQAIERIEFDDDSFIDKPALDALPIAPIQGTAGDDLLSGTPGNDTIEGGAGTDAYAVYLGMGRDMLVDASPSTEPSTLKLAPGLTLDALKARQSGDDLVVDIRGTADGVILKDYFATTQTWSIEEPGGALTAMQDLIDRPDPYAGNVALGAREDFRQALLAAWETETVASPLPTHALVFRGWSQTTFHFLGGNGLAPYTDVNPPVTTFSVNGYGVRNGPYFTAAPLVHHSIDVLATSQASDAATITAQSQAQQSSEVLTYGVDAGNIIPGYGAQSTSSTSTSFVAANAYNTTVSRSNTGWAPIVLTAGSGAGHQATLNITEIEEIRTLEEITGGASANVINGAVGIAAGHVALIDAGEGNDTVYAGPDDFAYGNEGDDTIYGGALVYGGNGEDTLEGGAVQYGGAGNDTLTGGQFMAGGSGDDAMTGTEGATAFFIGPVEVGADVVQDVAGISVEDLADWYYESIDVRGADEEQGGLWAITGDSLDRLQDLYYSAEDFPGYESQAFTDEVPLDSEIDIAVFFYLTIDDLRADLARVGAPYIPSDVRYLLPLDGLRANDFGALERFYDAGIIERDTVEFGEGVTLNDLTLTWNVVDVEDPQTEEDVPHAALEISWGANNSVSIAIPRVADLIGTGIEQFRFADGTVLSMAEMLELAPFPGPALPVDGTSSDDFLAGSDDNEIFTGYEGEDSIEGEGGDDVLIGGDGVDALDGGQGSDRYVYTAGETGIDHLNDSASNTEAYLDWYYRGQGLENWRLRPGYRYSGQYRIYRGIEDGYEYFETFEEAADAAAVDRNQPVHFVAPASVVAPLVTRNDTATLEQLVDEGIIDRDVVSFGPGLALGDLDISVSVFGPSAEAHPGQPWYGGGTLSVRWNSGQAGFDVTVPNVSYGDSGLGYFEDEWDEFELGKGIEAFEFADGSTYTMEQFLQEATVVLRYGYSFQRNSGFQVIEGEWTGVDFEAGIEPSEVVAERDGSDLVFRLTDFSAEALVPGWYSDPHAIPVWEFRFADGTVLDTDTITRLGLTQVGTPASDVMFGDGEFASALFGLGGVDFLNGGDANDLLDGGADDDFLTGGAGDDIYVFGFGYGSDEASEYDDDYAPGIDTVRFGAGVATTDVEVGQDYDGLVLTLTGGADVLRIWGWFEYAGGTVERFEFADGTVWDAATIEAALPPLEQGTADDDNLLGRTSADELHGLEGEDELYGYAGNDTLSGGPGEDYLDGGRGDDTYLYANGDGMDEISDRDGADSIVFAPGIDPQSVIVTRDAYSLILLPGQPGDRITVLDWFDEETNRIEQVVFDDGTIWDAAELESRLQTAPATEFDDVLTDFSGNGRIDGLGGDDSIYGLDGNDILEGGAGEDLIDGGAGNNVLLGGDDADYLYSNEPGVEFVAGGAGDEDILSINADGGILAFNVGDGVDYSFVNPFTIYTVSVGGADAQDIFLTTDGFDVFLNLNTQDALALGALAAWPSEIWPNGTLQLVDADIRTYDLNAVVQDFLDAYALDPQLGEWSAEQSLGTHLLTTSTSEAIGGAIAYRYATTGGVAGLSTAQMQAILADAGFGFDPQPIQLANAGPVLDNPVADQSVNEDAAFSFALPAGTFSDADMDELTYAATLADGSALPAWLSFDAETQVFSGTPLQADLGVIDVKVTATDGELSADDTFTVTVLNVNDAPVVSAADADVLLEDSALASSLFSVFDEDGQSPTQYEFFDDVEGGGHFTVGGVQHSAATAISVSAGALTGVEYVAGATPGTERVWVRAYDGEAWSAWKSWNMTSALHIPNAAPEATPTAATQTVLLDQSVAASALFSVLDADGDPATRYEFWDSTAGNGHFAVDGVEQVVNTAIVVDAADLADVTFVGGSEAGSDVVYVRATDGQTFGAWKSWTMNSWPHATNAAPVADAADGAVLRNQAVLAQSLFSVTDGDDDTITAYELWDDTAGGGYFALDGIEQTNNPIPVSAAQLADVEYVGGADPGTEQVWVRAYDGLEWGAWESWNMTTALHIPNAAPEATPTAATQTVLLGQSVSASSLFSVLDGDGDPVVRYEFFDSTSGNGHIAVDGVEQGINTAIVVEAADLADVTFVGGAQAGSDTVWVRASDGQSYGAWTSWSMNSWPHVTNAAPVAEAANANVLTGQVLSAASLFSVFDADGDAPARYEFFDDVAGGGYWRLAGVQQAAATEISVDAADLADAEYVGGANPGTEQVWVRVNDGMQWGAWESWSMSTVLHEPNAAPVVTAANGTVLLGQSVDASTLFAVTDADEDVITQYEFFDSTAGNGHFAIDGVEQGVNVAIGVTAAQLEDTTFVGSASTGADTVWVRAHDGMAWSDWKSWTMNSWPHATNAVPVVSAANSGILRNESLAAGMFFSVGDTDGDAPVQYEFWDDVNGGGHWALGDVQQAAGQAIAVSAAQLADLAYVGGANPGTEQVWVRASDGMGWSAWKNWLMATEGGMLRGGEGPDTLNGEAGPTVLQGGGGNDTLTDTDGDNLFSGGEGDDQMTGGDGDDLFAGGSGNDVINTGGGNNIIAYNAGGGIDTVYAGAGASNTLSFGGGISYDDLSLSKSGNDLVVSVGPEGQVVLKDWYAGSNSTLNLQIVHDASDEFDANSSDPLYNRKVQTFDFAGLVAEFDDALAQSPGLTSWAVTNALLQFHLSGSDDAAIGGDLAYWYGKNAGFTGISLQAAQAALGAPGFGSDAQTLQPFSGLQEGFVKLA